VVGLDVNAEEGQKTCDITKRMGGEMVFVQTDLSQDNDIEKAVSKAAAMGSIK
jgi:3-hydroxybutyrate dehydrogenase